MFCNKCGRQLPTGSVFCPLCGAPIAEVAGKTLGTNYWLPNAKKSNKRGGCLAILLAALVVAGVLSHLPTRLKRHLSKFPKLKRGSTPRSGPQQVIRVLHGSNNNR